jgi:hypothetical protein
MSNSSSRREWRMREEKQQGVEDEGGAAAGSG